MAWDFRGYGLSEAWVKRVSTVFESCCVSIQCIPLRADPSERGSLDCKYIQAWKIVGSRIYSRKFLLFTQGSNVLQAKKSKDAFQA